MNIGVFSEFFSTLAPDLNAVIQANINTQKPKKPYAVYRVISDKKNGHEEKKSGYNQATEEVTETINQNRQLQLELQIITSQEPKTRQEFLTYKSARDFSNEITIQLSTDKARLMYKDFSFTILDYIDYSNTDLSLGDVWERRAILEFTINYNQELVLSTIEGIKKPNTLSESGLTITYQE